ncbi:MAG: M1 family metallopeptidase [Pirellulales bacterium]|nr:M1 family metallopeptidase [Pirellulales bacterium]
MTHQFLFLLAVCCSNFFASGNAVQQGGQQQVSPAARAEVLRGAYDRSRANNDLLYYYLNVRIDPERKHISGKNTIRFKMLEADNLIQIDLHEALGVEKILFREKPLEYTREMNAVFIRFPQLLKAGETYEIEFHYFGNPKKQARFGGIAFRVDPQGRPWVNTACQGDGSSMWWPSKDHWRDEVESMDISVAVPNALTNVSNGRFQGKVDLGDGYTRWDYHVSYPINSYCVSLNVGTYEHFSEEFHDLTLDYYVLPERLDDAKAQFAQVKPMMEAFYHYFGEYPFQRDGFKLIHVPYAGMEHQSAVTYGNQFTNGYRNRDWTGVGVSMKFDFIIIHESGHEWFGNAVSAADVSDMWIHEGWTTYLECMYVEQVFGYEDALKYTNGYKNKVRNRQPIITKRGLHRTPPQDMYFKGALFLHTLRNVMHDDEKWWALVRATYDQFKYKNILTEEMIALFNEHFDRDMTPIFDEYLRHAQLPTLELQFDAAADTVKYRWRASEESFNMPIRVGTSDAWQTIQPTTQWQSMETELAADDFAVATDLYYVNVDKKDAAN